MFFRLIAFAWSFALYETFAQQAGTFVHSSVCLAVIHLLAIWSFPEIQRMNPYERILWSSMRRYYDLIWEDTMVSHERILWSHMRGYYGLTWEDTMVSYERILWSRMRGYYGLIWEDTMVSHERMLWSHMRGYYGLLMEDSICSVSDGRFGEWEVPCELWNR